VSRQGGSGIGGGMAAGRHRTVRPGQRLSHLQSLDCVGFLQPLRGGAVVIAGRLYCTWDCAVSASGMLPGQYFG